MTTPPPPAALRRMVLDLDKVPERMAELVAAHDGVLVGRSGPIRVALVCEPGLARDLLTRPAGTAQGRGIRVLKTILGQGLLTSDGDLHRRQRRLVQPAFHPSRIAGYAHDAVRAGRERAAAWTDGARVDLATEMSSLTLDVVGRTIFGTDVTADAREVSQAQGDLLLLFPRALRPLGLLSLQLPSPLRRRMRRDVARLDAVVERVVADRRARGDAGDMISMLLAVRDEETGEPMPARQIRDEVLTLLLAGHETTAVLLSWAWFELSRSPAVAARLEAEVSSTAGRAALDAADWQALPVTRAVVAETLRLRPPAHTLSRIATTQLDLGGATVPPATVCFVSPYALGRDPASWGPDAAAWRPERWLDDAGGFDEANPGQPRGAFLPFGAGSRVCIGAAFAQMEATLLLAALAGAWRAEVEPGFDPGLQPLVTLRPRRGVPATLHRRGAA